MPFLLLLLYALTQEMNFVPLENAVLDAVAAGDLSRYATLSAYGKIS